MEAVLKLLFGESTGWEHFFFIFFTFFGMLFIKLIRYRVKKLEMKAIGQRLVFSPLQWLDDNLIDFCLAFMASFGLFRFFPDAFGFINSFKELPEFTDKMAYGLFLGLLFQYILHKFFNKVTLEKTFEKMSTVDPTKPGGPKT